MISSADHFSGKILAMSVHNIGFLLDRLGQDCHPLQFLRELTQNSIEAIQRVNKSGSITWDVDWNIYDLEGVYKLCITDTGDGMTGEEMVKFINQLSSSVGEQSLMGNYGVGGKIAAATRNHAGLIYLSWKEGQGSMIQLYRDPQSQKYGLKQWQWEDGTYAHYLPIDDDVKPQGIESHGTRVILLGNSSADNTLQAPSASPSPSRWISKYLNTRYFSFPDDITVRSREGWENPRSDKDRNVLRTLTGQKQYLDNHAETSGIVTLNGAKAYWWILRDESAITSNSGYIESAGHVAALYQNELYELTSGRAGMSKLQQFGITFGYKFVVIYIEPDRDGNCLLTTNTARTILLINNEPLPWSDWAAEFRESMPTELKEFVEERASKTIASDHTKSIRDRLKDIMELFKISRYRPSPQGTSLIDTERLVRGGYSKPDGRTRLSSNPSGKEGGTIGNIYAVFEKPSGKPGEKVHPDLFPTVHWITSENGSREPGQMEDRAAQYLVDQNILLINSDFRVFADMQKSFEIDYKTKPGSADMIKDVVRGWFEQALVETIIGVQGLQNSKEWSPADIDTALSEEALTTAVMQRYHVHVASKRELSIKLGSPKS